MLTLIGERIILRDEIADDLDAMHAWLADPEVNRFLSWGTKNRTGTLLQLAEGIADQNNPDRRKYFLSMILKDGSLVIGSAGLEIRHRRDDSGEADLGYFLNRSYWGNGYATEAAKLLITFGFEQLKLHRITASTFALNTASERVMQRCGMVKEGVLRQSHYWLGEWQDLVCYSILRQEWASQNSTQKQ
jgi:[ribosomal protein S5]-alanine N-acetyltransferase